MRNGSTEEEEKGKAKGMGWLGKQDINWMKDKKKAINSERGRQTNITVHCDCEAILETVEWN